MDYLELLRYLNSKIRDGNDPAEVAAYLQERHGLSMDELRQRVAQQTADETAPLQQTVRQGTIPRAAASAAGAAVGGLGANMLQGVTAEWADEGIGKLNKEWQQKYRDFLSQTRGDHPIASGAATMLGAAIPVGRAMGLANRAGNTIARGAATGAATGLVGSAGASEGSLGDRLSDPMTWLGTGLGAGFGAAGGMVGKVNQWRRTLQEADAVPSRVANQLRQTSGVSRTTGQIRDAFDNEIAKIQKDLFGPLERRYADGINSPQITQTVQRLKQDVAVAPTVRAALRRPENVIPDNPTFKEFQRLVQKLGARSDDNSQAYAQELKDLFAQIDPDFDAANTAYANVMGNSRAFTEGTRRWGSNSIQLDEVMRRNRDLRRPGAMESFREGRVLGQLDRIERREMGSQGQAVGHVKRLMEAGSSTRESLRGLFNREQDFEQFMDFVAKQEDTIEGAIRIKAMFEKLRTKGATLAKLGAASAGAGAGWRLLDSMRSGGSGGM